MSFEALKRSRGNFDKLTKELEVLNKFNNITKL